MKIPRQAELALIGWESEVEIVKDTDFQPVRTIGDQNSKVIAFSSNHDGTIFATTENFNKPRLHDSVKGTRIEIDTENSQSN